MTITITQALDDILRLRALEAAVQQWARERRGGSVLTMTSADHVLLAAAEEAASPLLVARHDDPEARHG
jgi:20S proteasome alpha/beta subunit